MAHFIRVSNIVFASLIVWTIYHLNFTLQLETAAAIALFIAISLLFRGKENRVEVSRILALSGWSLVLFIVYHIWFHYTAGQGLLSALENDFWKGGGFSFIAADAFTIILTIAVIFIFLVTPEAGHYPGYAWHQIPILCFMLVRHKWQSLLHAAGCYLPLIWLAVLIDRRSPQFGHLAAFLIILFGMLWLQRIVSGAAKPGEAVQGKSHLIVSLPLVFGAVVLAVYGIGFGLNVIFLTGMLSALSLLGVCYILVKLRLFLIIKWSMIAFSFFVFTLFLLQLRILAN